MKIALNYFLFFNVIFTAIDTFAGVYEDKRLLYIYWAATLVMILLMFYSHIKNKPKVIRVVYIMMLARVLEPWFNFKARTKFNDMASVAFYCVYISHCCTCLIVCIGLSESYLVHLPVSLLFTMNEAFGIIYVCLYFSGNPSEISDIFKKHSIHVVLLGFGLLFVQYSIVIIGSYLINKNKLMMN